MIKRDSLRASFGLVVVIFCCGLFFVCICILFFCLCALFTTDDDDDDDDDDDTQLLTKLVSFFAALINNVNALTYRRSSLNPSLRHCVFHLLLYIPFFSSSVTRFGEISALWQICNGLFLIWKNVELTLANLLHYWANFHRCKWSSVKK